MQNNNFPMVSIIIPIYNAEPYLRQCIDSILAQSFSDFELLLVDDGSTDSSGMICDEYAHNDNCLRVFHKVKGGVSSARNLGLDNAKGEWILFVDADDYLCDHALDLMKDDRKEDLIINSFLEIEDEAAKKPIVLEKGTWRDASAKEFLSKVLHEFYMCSSCGKFFRRNIISNLRFDERIRMSEDAVFMLNFLSKIHSVYVSDCLFYACRMLPPALFPIKYNLTPSEGVYLLSQLVSAYKKLGFGSTEFERTIFFVSSVCMRNLNGNPKLWYQNTDVIWIYERIKNTLGWKFRIKYRLQSIPLINRAACWLRDYLENRKISKEAHSTQIINKAS